jgi:hypothetical protein
VNSRLEIARSWMFSPTVGFLPDRRWSVVPQRRP